VTPIATPQTSMACSLDNDKLSSRLGRIALLAKRHLQSERQDGQTLQLQYASAATDELRSIVELERQCCPFLVFDLKEAHGAIELAITAPTDAGTSVATIFDDFRGAIADQPTRSCAGSGCGCAA
jgi:hypothetical protein